ncbi:mitochondrial import inner membrane translocase subunit Tim10 B-like [Asterias rubens]|uniref:mitochondrial import inner membrane translocase subunit Tim10 B-like n=1 Tax=Asterias rubens TaxID=7604 RepID=UPI001455B792|nr:mitochondrial import inner membrane translocase subunit Tim10 B-like [Asterias rubens]
MEDYARRNLKDFLSMYNQFTEVCFNHCVQNFNYRHMIPEETSCANRCAEKLINVNHRLISVYMEINPLHKQAAALEASQAIEAAQTAEAATQDTTAPPDTPSLNLAGQVEAVFGSDTIVTDSSPPVLDIANDVMNPVDSNLQGVNTNQGTSLENSGLNISSDSTEQSAMS